MLIMADTERPFAMVATSLQVKPCENCELRII